MFAGAMSGLLGIGSGALKVLAMDNMMRLPFKVSTTTSNFMIGVNELHDLKCNKKAILEKLIIALTPYAPHVCEELWSAIGGQGLVLDATFPAVEIKYLVESSKTYPVAINGKTRTELKISLTATQEEVEALVMQDEIVKKWLGANAPKKIIYVKNKMINIVP